MRPQLQDLSTPLAYALAYARLGWHVFPVERGAKVPVGRLVPRGHLEATTDEAIIRRWWRLAPDAGIGVSLSASGLAAIDVDPRNGGNETMDDLERAHGSLRSDVYALTGGGGEHHVFLLPAGMHPTLPGTLGPGVDVKVNGYIVVEPSVHASGRTYQWEASSSPLDGIVPSALPDWLRSFSRASEAQETPRTGTGKVASGGRNNYLSRKAYGMRRLGLAIEHIEAALTLVNRDDCDPPLPEEEVRRIASGKARIDEEPYLTFGSAQAAAEAGGLVLTVEQLHAQAGAVQWLIKGVVPTQSLGFVFGASGTFKSFLALDMALHVCYGMQWMGRRTKQRDVVYLAAEGGAGLMKRIEAWHKDRGMLWQECPMRAVVVPLTLRTEATMLREAITGCGVRPGLLVIDTLSQTYSGDENSNSEMAEWLRVLGLELRDALQCAVQVIHHTGHSATERPRGASSIIANIDYALGVYRDEQQMLVHVEFVKIKDGERPDPAQFELQRLELGRDEDGDTISSLSARWLPPAEVLNAIRREAASGRGGHVGELLGIVRPGMLKDDARRAFYATLDEASADTKKKAFQRAVKQLLDSGAYTLRNGSFWAAGT